MIKQTKRPFILAAIMLAMFVSAVEATIVATVMPGIVVDLGGFLGNGGSPHRVNGVVAGPDGQKYEVLMEFIEGEQHHSAKRQWNMYMITNC